MFDASSVVNNLFKDILVSAKGSPDTIDGFEKISSTSGNAFRSPPVIMFLIKVNASADLPGRLFTKVAISPDCPFFCSVRYSLTYLSSIPAILSTEF